jgi:feruloyl esterase
MPHGHAKAAQSLANLPAVMPAIACSAITSLNLAGVTDGTVTITSATVLPASTNESQFTLPAPACDVKGTIGPGTNKFELLLPTQGWTQRYLQSGCGGLCGNIGLNPTEASTCVPVTGGQIAIAATDMGHEGNYLPNSTTTWETDPQAKIDFAYRGQHVTSQVAKAIIARFYGRPAKYTYFDGCSDGGREALMEVQRYPDDFDGIAAGAPANDLDVLNTYHHGWNIYSNIDPSTQQYILLAGKLPLLHAAVLAACDALDGVVDNVIDDPRACHFNPASLLCAPAQDASTCLSAAEVAVVRKLHEGPVDQFGRHLEQPIAHEWGSELEWTLFVPANAEGPAGDVNFIIPFLQYLAFYNGSAHPELSSFSSTDNAVSLYYPALVELFTVTPFRQNVQTQRYDAATDPDLTPFQRRGGKLILWHGWEDQHITPQGTLQYWSKMAEYMGEERVETFSKLYMFPCIPHCGGATQPGVTVDGPNVFDILTPVMAWVETGTKPGVIVATGMPSPGVTRTRPVYPYPTVARYTGTGSTDVAANFAPYTPRMKPYVATNWIGVRLYSPGYEQSCQAQNGQLVCVGGDNYDEAGRSGNDDRRFIGFGGWDQDRR